MEGLLSEADVLAPGVPALEITNPYLSVITFVGVAATASDVASALNMTIILRYTHIVLSIIVSECNVMQLSAYHHVAKPNCCCGTPDGRCSL